MDKKRRDTIRNRIDEGGNFAYILAKICFSKTELRTLLDLADERDRYRALLEEARRGYLKDGTIFAREIDAALEGKTNE